MKNFITLAYKAPSGQQTSLSIDKYLFDKAKSKLANADQLEWVIKEVIYSKEIKCSTISRSKVAKDFLVDLISKN